MSIPSLKTKQTIALQTNVIESVEGVAVRMSSGRKVLAASTLFSECNESRSSYFGFIISYMVKAKLLVMGAPFKTGISTQVPVVFVAKKPLTARKQPLKNRFESCI